MPCQSSTALSGLLRVYTQLQIRWGLQADLNPPVTSKYTIIRWNKNKPYMAIERKEASPKSYMGSRGSTAWSASTASLLDASPTVTSCRSRPTERTDMVPNTYKCASGIVLDPSASERHRARAVPSNPAWFLGDE